MANNNGTVNTEEITYEWKEWDDDSVAQDENAAKGAQNFLKLTSREDPYIIRFLPALKGEDSFCKVVWQHYMDLPDGNRFVAVCPKTMARKPCPICKKIDKLYETGNPRDEKFAKKISPKTRVFANVVNRENEAAGPLIFAYGKMIHDELIKLRRNPRRGGDFTHPFRGFDIEVYMEGSGFDTKYTVYACPERSPLGTTAQINDWLGSKHPLDRYARILTPEQIIAGMRGDDTRDYAPRSFTAPAGPPRVLEASVPDRTPQARLGVDDEDDLPF